MVIRLHDGSSFKTKGGSNIVFHQPEPGVVYLHWLSETNTEQKVLANKVRQIEP